MRSPKVWAEYRRQKLATGVWGMPSQEISKMWVSEIAFPAFWEHIFLKISASQNKVLMVKFVINCMLNIHTQHKFKYAHQQILFFKRLFNVKLIYSIQVLGPWLWGNRPFFSSVVGQRKGPSGANAPPLHGIKKCLGLHTCKSLIIAIPYALWTKFR
jgi:hypothetical protein